MKKIKFILPALALGFCSPSINAQEEFNVEIEPITITNAPALHSFSWGKTKDNKWIFVGGRIEGLHQRQPNAAFKENFNNKDIFVVDPISDEVWSTSLSSLPASIYEQLQSTNQQFFQRDSTLYVTGGYGYSTTQADHVTYKNLTAIDIEGVANAVINNDPLITFFRQITDATMGVTGGQMGYLDSTFYLAGGQYFEGRYNPMGPNNGPGFIQAYTDEIRTFKILDDGTNLSIVNYSAQNSTADLHRRDYNMAPQIFPNGEHGFTMFSGVFDPNDLPFLNSVNITSSGYEVNNDFTQYLSQYHSAKIAIYDSTNKAMHTLFFGGMSQYTLDGTGNLVQDDNVPFVKTISKVTRLQDSTMQEIKLNIEMPTLLGAGAEFIPISDTSIYMHKEILKINKIPAQKTLIGYIVGGIESTAANIFFVNDGTQSSASNQVFAVYINKSTVGLHEVELTGDNVFNLKLSPNPTKDNVVIDFFVPDNTPVSILIYNIIGEQVKTIAVNKEIGNASIQIDVKDLPIGEYIVQVKGKNHSGQKILIKQ